MVIRLPKYLQSSLWLILLCSLSGSCAVFAQDWKSPFFHDHPLVGKIWDTRKNAWITEQRLRTELLEYDYLLLGESHDNEDHHVLQSRLLNSIAAAGTRPTVVMEMLARESWQRQPRTWTDLQALQGQAKAHNADWPWELYVPVLQSVVQHGLELVAGNVSSGTLYEWSGEVESHAAEVLLDEYPVTPDGLRQLQRNVTLSHCGYANAEYVRFMMRAQLQRDQVMAAALVASKPPVVLIAGSGHVRKDYAVPIHLFKRHHRFSYLSVALIPVLPKLLEPGDYMDDISRVFDILYFTPSHTNQDPCVRFRKRLEGMRR